MKQTRFLQVSVIVALLVFGVALAQDATVTNDETQGMLRVNNCVFGGPNVDVLVNGEVATNGGVPQTNQGFWTSGYLFLEPGTHSVAIVPTGEDTDHALIGPLDVPMVAGHRYTLVVMGQADEPSHEALLIDETAAYQEIGATPTDTAHITVNNLRGIAGITWTLTGEVREDNVPYSEFQAALWPSGTFTGFEATFRHAETDDTDSGSVSGEMFNAPGNDSMDCFGGTPSAASVMETDGQDWSNRTSPPNSTLSALDFLKTLGSVEGSDNTFNTFLGAVETAGLTDLLTNGGPHFVLVPTDEAFAALSQDRRDALIGDPKALAEVLRYHIVEGYYPVGALGGEERSAKVLTNLLGMELELEPGGGSISGTPVGDIESVVVANGTRVGPITTVLMPPEQ